MEMKTITIRISRETIEDMKQTCDKIRKQNNGNNDIAKMLAWLSTIIVKAEPQTEETPAPIKEFHYIDTDSVITKTKTDIDDIAMKISIIQDIKTRLEELDKERQKLSEELEELRDQVMNYL